MSAPSPENRIRLISLIVCGAAIFFAGRLFVVQVVNGSEYEQRAYRQNTNSASTVYDRGTIYFTTKDGESVPAASIESTYFVAVDPAKLTNVSALFDLLGTSTRRTRAEFEALVADKTDPYVEVVHGLSASAADGVRSRKFAGVQVFEERFRSYPFGSSASQVVGFVARDAAGGDELKGRYGLERQFETTLQRNPDAVYDNFFSGIVTGISKSARGESSQFSEGDVVTSIEPTVQRELEASLKLASDQWKSSSVGGIVIEPSTGRIVAMGSLPTYDPNDLKNATLANMKNPGVESVFEMGSIIKPLTMAAALDEGVVTASTTYFDAGFRDIDKSHIENFDGKGRGKVSMQEVLNQSLNTGAVFAMEQLGIDRFRARMFNYGFGEKTGVDLPGDNKGLVKNFDSKRLIEYATASYGQGFAVSPLAVVRALSALANGGLLVTPHVVDSIDYRMNVGDGVSMNPPKRILKESTSKEISRMLTIVVDKALLQGKYANSRYSVAAKTGTALLTDTKGGYDRTRFLHTFFGYFPATKARFLIFLYNYDPKGAQYASATLTDPFMKLMEFLVQYYEIPPDRSLGGTHGSTTISVIQR